jgi:hypothetical protein
MTDEEIGFLDLTHKSLTDMLWTLLRGIPDRSNRSRLRWRGRGFLQLIVRN